MATRVSIVTPCYNAARYIFRTIESVQAQTLTDWEMIVVDDGSQDESATIVERAAQHEPRLRLVRQANQGVSAARNTGFRSISPTSECLLFLDADDCLEPTMLAEMTRHLDQNPTVGMVFCDPIFIDAEDKTIPPNPELGWQGGVKPSPVGVRRLDPREQEVSFTTIFSLMTIIPSISLMRRSAYEQTPGWDESFGHIYEDTDMFLNLALHARTHHLHRSLVRYRRHPTQSTANIDRVSQQEQKLYAKWAAILPTLGPEHQRVVEAGFRFRNGRLASWVGGRTAVRRLIDGDVTGAARFGVGAVRRYVLSFVAPHRLGATTIQT